MNHAMDNTLLTIDGHIGAGAYVVGKKLSRMMGLRLFDRVQLPTVANLPAGTVDSAAAHAADAPDFSDRLWRWIERVAAQFAVGAAADDPLLQGGADLHLPLTWDRTGPSAATSDEPIADLDALARDGNAVIVHRAGAVALAHDETAMRVGIFADWEDRVARVMQREGLNDVSKAERVIAMREEAQREYFRNAHRADPEDHAIYDFVINTSEQNIDMATIQVSRFVKRRRELVSV